MFPSAKVQIKSDHVDLTTEYQSINQCEKKILENKVLALNVSSNALACALIKALQNKPAKAAEMNKASKKLASLIAQIQGQLIPTLEKLKQTRDVIFEKGLSNKALTEKERKRLHFDDTTITKKLSTLRIELTKGLSEQKDKIFGLIDDAQVEQLQLTFQALNIYEKILNDSLSVISTNQASGVLATQMLISLQHRKSLLSDSEEIKEINGLIDDFNRILTKINRETESFQSSTINNISVESLLTSAPNRYKNICDQINEGSFEQAGLNLRIAERYEMGDVLKNALANAKKISEEVKIYEQYAHQQLANLSDRVDRKNIANPAEVKPQKSKDSALASADNANNKKIKTRNSERSKGLKAESVKSEHIKKIIDKDARVESKPQMDMLGMRLGLHNKVQWIRSDLNELNEKSQSNTKKELVENLHVPLKVIEDRLDNDMWPKTGEAIAAHKKAIEQELDNLSALLEQIKFAESRPNSPEGFESKDKKPASLPENLIKIKPPVGYEKPLDRTLESADMSKSVDGSIRNKPLLHEPALSEQASIKERALTVAEPVSGNIGATFHVAESFDQFIQGSALRVSESLHRLNMLSIQKNSMQANLLVHQAAQNPAWINVYQAQALIDYLHTGIVECPHRLYILPYQEYIAPASEMIRLIQLEKSNPHFNQANVADFLNYIHHWLGQFEGHFQQLEHLLK